jgi:aspartate racemase
MTKSNNNVGKVAGVLGGLGPEATVDFMAKILAATEANCDQDHIRMLVDHNPGVPNRHKAIAGLTPSVGPQLAAMAKGLEDAGSDFLVMVCNTAHAYSEDILAAVGIPFVSIIDVTIEALAGRGVTQVGVMAAEGCIRAELYQGALTASGYEPVLWSDSQLEEFMVLVYRIKAGERDDDIGAGISRLANSLVFDGAEVLISGCTEIPLFMNAEQAPAPLLSSTDLLVQRTIEIAKGAHHASC